jgi:hypothetical protein
MSPSDPKRIQQTEFSTQNGPSSQPGSTYVIVTDYLSDFMAAPSLMKERMHVSSKVVVRGTTFQVAHLLLVNVRHSQQASL